MRFEELPDRLVVQDQQTNSRYFGIALVVFGLAIAIVPWTIPIRHTSPKLYVAMTAVSVINAVLAGWGVRKFFNSPLTEAVFERENRRLVFKRKTLRPVTRMVPFKAIEMVMVAEKVEGDGKIFRLSVGTRTGERLPISHWKRQPGQVLDIARILNMWIRNSLPSENKTEAAAQGPGGVR